MVLDEIIEALSFFDKDVTITRSPCELTAYRVLILVKLTPALKQDTHSWVANLKPDRERAKSKNIVKETQDVANNCAPK